MADPTDPRVLVINSGSSSLKFQLLAPAEGTVDAVGIVERVGQDSGTATITAGERSATFEGPVPDHQEAMAVVEQLFEDVGLSLTDERIRAVGHRVVQGGARYSAPVLVDEQVRWDINDLGKLAPLHNYAAVHGIDGAQALLPHVPHVAVFDTAFFTDLPEAAATYALDRDFAERYRVRRYGAHGTSHRFVSEAVSSHLAAQGRDVSDLRQVVLHLGNGASASAVRGGRAVETSMGLTPLEGLVMGTRTGDIDPSIYIHLHRQAGLSPEEIDSILNRRSGMIGLCGKSDFRDITAAVEAGDASATLAMDVYVHRLRKYLGSYAFTLGGLDVVAFTAGIGENVPMVRERLLTGLEGFGLELDREANARREKGIRVISTPGSAVTVLIVPTDEELSIAQQAAAVARDLG
ncbi:acetate/propionate family kinase [Brachybacterium saurashtrense]|uniref:Acetate kinase n=1 Tax=Brachybacterium saurashtrense TaxID=556288 RepID=A0A345YKJ8_9MICO|nr:acetate kinase [Brachybacterium saurashtrense]AXK44450.1 acetate kinase [Brachybacterium saurashtrense]RRR23062.1 acetate kinase [Brachybacterium saurashtrense]